MMLSERIRKQQDYEPPLQASEVLLRDTCGQWADEVARIEDEYKALAGYTDALASNCFEQSVLLHEHGVEDPWANSRKVFDELPETVRKYLRSIMVGGLSQI